ncbi:MAG: pyridoxal 5'-phosphate synthase glutaminase subunit PdxT [Desulfomonilaceae bacterium]
MRIGVLAVQGDFQEHCAFLNKIGVETVEVRLPQDLHDLDALIIPGGESTTIGKLARQYNLIEELRKLSKTIPIWGTCGGLVFMAKEVGFDQPLLGIMDIEVERNAFGRQVESFEQDLFIDGLKGPAFPGIFIRAPVVKNVGKNVRVLCQINNDRIVAVRQNNLLATSFHPELTSDDRLHRYFIAMVENPK